MHGRLSEGHLAFYPDRPPIFFTTGCCGPASAHRRHACADLCLTQWLAALALVVADCENALSLAGDRHGGADRGLGALNARNACGGRFQRPCSGDADG